MIECTRNNTIKDFGPLPARESQFQVMNFVDPQQRQQIRRAFGKVNGFDRVLAFQCDQPLCFA